MIHNNSVCDCLTISMKLQRFIVVFLLGVAGLAEVANGLCLVRNTTDANYYWYQCFMSTDYLADVKKGPIDIQGHSVVSSKIEVIRNGYFGRWSKTLDSLGIVFCGVREIEDNAFKGLTNMTYLSLAGNKLEVLKSTWLKGLSKLRVVSFQNNRIKHVDDDFFSTLPRRLNTLDMPNNLLTCLPTASFGNFKVSEFSFRNNRLTWKCRAQVMNWLKRADIAEDSLKDDDMDPPHVLAEICMLRHPQSETDGELLDKCIADTTHELLPLRGNYTVAKVCEFLKRKPSPFLNCNE